jgi:hypothetical protein
LSLDLLPLLQSDLAEGALVTRLALIHASPVMPRRPAR